MLLQKPDSQRSQTQGQKSVDIAASVESWQDDVRSSSFAGSLCSLSPSVFGHFSSTRPCCELAIPEICSEHRGRDWRASLPPSDSGGCGCQLRCTSQRRVDVQVCRATGQHLSVATLVDVYMPCPLSAHVCLSCFMAIGCVMCCFGPRGTLRESAFHLHIFGLSKAQASSGCALPASSRLS